jgi:hypothetical protein
MFSLGAVVPADRVRALRGQPGEARLASGLRFLVPGYAQWSWQQQERALIFFGSFVTALGVAAFAWGTWTGLALLAFAFGTHVASTVDVVRQTAFPGFGRWMPVVSASGGLALGVYGPVLVLASLVAWPAMPGGASFDGYLVNGWAYRGREPDRGDWVWLRTSPWAEPRIGRVVAGPGAELEWSEGVLRLAGLPIHSGTPLHSLRPPSDLAYVVPEGHVLVDPEVGSSAGRPILVPRNQILGRAWARFYPVWERRFLP